VLLEEFGIRRGSGGKGKWSAGDGTLRRIRFLEQMDCAILASFRTVRPYGLEGGEPGECGENWVRRNDGRMERLQGCDQTILEAADIPIQKAGFRVESRASLHQSMIRVSEDSYDCVLVAGAGKCITEKRYRFGRRD